MCTSGVGHTVLTVSVGEQLHQAVQTRVANFSDVGGAAADGLDGGGHKVFIHAFDVCLPGAEGKKKQPVMLSFFPNGLKSLYLKLSKNRGDVCLIGKIGENLQLH